VEYTLVAVTPLVAFIVSRAGKIIKMDPVLWKSLLQNCILNFVF